DPDGGRVAAGGMKVAKVSPWQRKQTSYWWRSVVASSTTTDPESEMPFDPSCTLPGSACTRCGLWQSAHSTCLLVFSTDSGSGRCVVKMGWCSSVYSSTGWWVAFCICVRMSGAARPRAGSIPVPPLWWQEKQTFSSAQGNGVPKLWLLVCKSREGLEPLCGAWQARQPRSPTVVVPLTGYGASDCSCRLPIQTGVLWHVMHTAPRALAVTRNW